MPETGDKPVTPEQCLEQAEELAAQANVLRAAGCRCAGIEKFIRSDTGGEFSGVCVTCTLCGRRFDLDEAGRVPPSDEDKIRDAMAEAQQHPGRMVTWAQDASGTTAPIVRPSAPHIVLDV